jgi:hypothetical protein
VDQLDPAGVLDLKISIDFVSAGLVLDGPPISGNRSHARNNRDNQDIFVIPVLYPLSRTMPIGWRGQHTRQQ